MSDYALRVEGVCKDFAGVRALNHVSLEVEKGEIHALIGENGAGKSTLVRIIAGAEQKDAGKIYLDGREVEITSPRVGRELGISVIYQEYILAPDLSVAENIFIDRLSKGGGLINWRKLRQETREILAQIGFADIKPETRVSDLKVAYQQVVEICKALSRQSRILILDEPTSVLTFKEKEKLFSLLQKLREKGVSIIYISHRLEELFELSDAITVFKDGAFVSRLKTKETSMNELISLMIGRELTNLFPPRTAGIGVEVLRVEALSRGKAVQDVSFSVRAGEVAGFSGLVGAGRTETMRLIYGADRRDGGRIFLHGRNVEIRSTADALRSHIGFLPEDRKLQGVILEMPIRVNATMASLRKIERFRCISRAAEKKLVGELIRYLSIRLGSMEDDVSTLSGGNQQKVAFAKWIASDCDCIILDEPTRGVDVGAKVEIYQIINRMAEQGMAVIVVSSEMLELMGICDRILVMREGRIAGELQKPDFSEKNLIRLAMEV